jgi:hypothetical protein
LQPHSQLKAIAVNAGISIFHSLTIENYSLHICISTVTAELV